MVDKVARVSNEDMRVRISMRCMRDFLEPTAAYGYASGDWIFGFSSWEAKEHICGVGFVRQRLDLHISKRGGTTCLRDRRHGCETTMVVLWQLCEVQISGQAVSLWWIYVVHMGNFFAA